MKRNILMAFAAAFALTGFAADGAAPPKEAKLAGAERQPALLLGDSMMRLMGKAIEKELKAEGYEATTFSSIGSGLARLDVFDWFSRIDSTMKEAKPAVVVVTLGANDRQALQDGAGNVLQFGTAEWREEYGKRIGRAMDVILENGAKRIVWLELPDMKEHLHQNYADLVNAIYAEQAAMDSRKDKVSLFSMRRHLSKVPGKYTSFLMSPQGQALQVRDSDGVHLSQQGAKIMARALVDAFWRD
jgi:hypothetical protein